MANGLNLSSSVPSLGNSPPTDDPTLVTGLAPGPVEGEGVWETYDAPDDLSPEQQEFSALRELEQAPTNTTRRLLWLILLFVGAGSYSAYEVIVNEQNPFDTMLLSVDDLVKFGLGPDEALSTAASSVGVSDAQTPSARKVDTVPAKESALPAEVDNKSKVYRSLPNKVPSPLAKADAAKGEEEIPGDLVEGINHEFVYQRFKTIQDIRKQKLLAATDLLRQGLVDEKFWNRMYSAITLAEFGVPVTVAELGEAIGDTRSELIANFFRRFLKKPSSGELYIMRQMLSVADERGRMVLLQAIAGSQDDLRDLYLVAASMENSAKIKGWATTAVNARRLPPEQLQKLKEQVLR